MTLFARRLDWLYSALRLNEAAIPVELDTTMAQSVIDVYQGGESVAIVQDFEFDFIESQAENEVEIVPASPDRTRIVHHVECFNSAASTWFWNISMLAVQRIDVQVAQADVLTMATLGTQQLLPAGRFVVPPTFSVRVFFSATGVGDIRRFKLVALSYPFGSNPNY